MEGAPFSQMALVCFGLVVRLMWPGLSLKGNYMTEFFVLMLLFALVAFWALAFLWVKLSPYFPNGIIHALKEPAPPTDAPK